MCYGEQNSECSSDASSTSCLVPSMSSFNTHTSRSSQPSSHVRHLNPDSLQVSRCVEAETPPECPEKDAGAPNCNPLRSGIFAVEGREIYLHVGFDVSNELSCMATANAILMGCSTFGQVAGVLNRGIRFFSVECGGFRTTVQYKLIPPMVSALILIQPLFL